MEQRTRLTWTAIVLCGVVTASVDLRRRTTHWGAVPDEVARVLPGDDIVVAPQYSATNAVTVRAPSSAVWPWLVQMGAHGRAGWYSFDRLDNGGVPSAQEIVPGLQDLRVGDVMATDRSGGGFLVEAIEPNHALVLSIRAVDAVTSSAFVLEPTADGRTRLVIRVRLRTAGTAVGLWYRTIMELGHVVMTRQMLLGIRARAERMS